MQYKEHVNINHEDSMEINFGKRHGWRRKGSRKAGRFPKLISVRGYLIPYDSCNKILYCCQVL